MKFDSIHLKNLHNKMSLLDNNYNNSLGLSNNPYTNLIFRFNNRQIFYGQSSGNIYFRLDSRPTLGWEEDGYNETNFNYHRNLYYVIPDAFTELISNQSFNYKWVDGWWNTLPNYGITCQTSWETTESSPALVLIENTNTKWFNGFNPGIISKNYILGMHFFNVSIRQTIRLKKNRTYIITFYYCKRNGKTNRDFFLKMNNNEVQSIHESTIRLIVSNTTWKKFEYTFIPNEFTISAPYESDDELDIIFKFISQGPENDGTLFLDNIILKEVYTTAIDFKYQLEDTWRRCLKPKTMEGLWVITIDNYWSDERRLGKKDLCILSEFKWGEFTMSLIDNNIYTYVGTGEYVYTLRYYPQRDQIKWWYDNEDYRYFWYSRIPDKFDLPKITFLSDYENVLKLQDTVSVYNYLDNLINGKNYRISFKIMSNKINSFSKVIIINRQTIRRRVHLPLSKPATLNQRTLP